MTPSASAAANSGAVNPVFQHWKSPVPYLFAGLALMLGLIALALLILACSFRKTYSDRAEEGGRDKSSRRPPLPSPEMEPKIVVIMAGDDNPTYLAKPAAASSGCRGDDAAAQV